MTELNPCLLALVSQQDTGLQNDYSWLIVAQNDLGFPGHLSKKTSLHRHTAHGFKHAPFTFTLITDLDMLREVVSLVTELNKTTQ